jgi:aminoglycoside phosphotransferase (APT) family kinase protein
MNPGTDPVFPHIAQALDPAVMGPLLRQTLKLPPPVDGTSAGCVIGEKRYKPGRSVLVNYRLEEDSASMAEARHATARLCPPGQARAEFARERARRPDLDEGALLCLEEPAMLLWVFPHDRKLTHLHHLLDARTLGDRLAPALAALGLSYNPSQLQVASKVLHYLPERSCMIRYRIEGAVPATGSPVYLYAKIYADETGAQVYAHMRQLAPQFPYGARALAYDEITRTLWQSQVPGRPPIWQDLLAQHGSALAAHMGRCAAALHACTLETSRQLEPDGIRKALTETVSLIARMSPHLARLTARTVETLLASPLPQVTRRVAPVHNDLKLNNFLVDAERVGLIDMDCLCLGDPLGDLGSLIANLYLHGLREGAGPQAVHPVAGALTRAYRAQCGDDFSLASLRWHVAAALIHEVTRRSLRQMDPQRMAHIQGFLELGAHYAALSEKPEGGGDELV